MSSPMVLPGLSEFGIHVLQDILQFIGRDGAISVLILGLKSVNESSLRSKWVNESSNATLMFVIGKQKGNIISAIIQYDIIYI